MGGKNTKKARKPQKRSFVRDYLEPLVIALVLALIIKTSIVEAYKIPSGSMEDTLLVGDFLLANKFIYGAKVPLLNVHLPALREPKSGDIVIFKYPKDPKVNYIKRCIAVEGDTVEIRNKVVYVNGRRFPDPTHSKYTDSKIYAPGMGQRDNFGPYVVPEGHLFMMGDNRDNSLDSRFWGPLSRELVSGKAMIIHWSWNSNDPNAPNSLLKNIGYNILHFPQRVRWGRIGDIIR